jgi:hypothetical protein
MATTTNYGWTTPDDTALVKDGASAIRTLGSSVDTTTKALNPSTTLGDIEYRSSTANTNTRLGIGSAGQLLSVSAGVPAWTTFTSGGLTLISETTASALSSLSLSSIAGTYKQIMLEWEGIYHSDGSTTFHLRFNNDSASNYWIQNFDASNATLTRRSLNQGTASNYGAFGTGVNATNTDYYFNNRGFLLIDNYASSTKAKKYRLGFQHYNNGGSAYQAQFIQDNFYNSTTAITSIDVVRTAGTGTFSNVANTTIRLYGLS